MACFSYPEVGSGAVNTFNPEIGSTNNMILNSLDPRVNLLRSDSFNWGYETLIQTVHIIHPRFPWSGEVRVLTLGETGVSHAVLGHLKVKLLNPNPLSSFKQSWWKYINILRMNIHPRLYYKCRSWLEPTSSLLYKSLPNMAWRSCRIPE